MNKVLCFSLLLLVSVTLLSGCEEPSSYTSCKRDCIDVQCANMNETCGWWDYKSWVSPEGNDNAKHNLTYEEGKEIEKKCFEFCGGRE